MNYEMIRRIIGQQPGEIVAVIHYGNPAGADDDILAVTADNGSPPKYQAVGRGLDISFISLAQLEEQLDWADPAMTEPVTTGYLLEGSRAAFDQWRQKLGDKEVTERDWRLMEDCAADQLAYAKSWLAAIGQLGEQARLNALCTLSFAASYRLFAANYRCRPRGVITFARLRQSGNETLEQAVALFKQAKAGEDIEPAQIAAQIAAVERLQHGSG